MVATHYCQPQFQPRDLTAGPARICPPWIPALLLLVGTAAGNDAMKADWDARTARVGGFSCTVEEAATYRLNWLQRMGFKTPQQTGTPAELQCRRSWRLHSDGHRFYFRRTGELPNQTTGTLTTDDRQVAFDGVVQTALSAPDANRDFSDAVIQSNPMDLEQLTLKPVWWYVRFTDPRGIGCSGNQFQAIPSQSQLLRVECTADGGWFEFDTHRDHVPVKYWNRRENPLVIVEIEYSDGMPVRPAKWTITSFGEGQQEVISECQVTEWRENLTFTSEDFQLGIPPGSLIHDQRSGGTYQLKDKQGRIESLSKNEITTDIIHHRIESSPLPSTIRNRWLVPLQVVLRLVTTVSVIGVRMFTKGKRK